MSAARLEFEARVLDWRAGDVKLAGDVDKDGRLDLFVGGEPYEGMTRYRAPDWRPEVVAIPLVQFTTDGALGDIDSDGDLDIVVPDGSAGRNLVWLEMPGPAPVSLDTLEWSRHSIGAIGDWGKDVELFDFDGDGQLDVATRSPNEVMIWFQTSSRDWRDVRFSGLRELGEEGMGAGDLDGDGDIDLAFSGTWLQNPGSKSARAQGAWPRHRFAEPMQAAKIAIADLDGDGASDIILSNSEGAGPIAFFSREAAAVPRWRKQVVVSQIEKVHTLQPADMDGDGDLDLVVAQMHTARDPELTILFNEDGIAGRWGRQVIDRSGLHNGLVVDADGDGDLDIFGANWTGHPPVRLWLNQKVKARP